MNQDLNQQLAEWQAQAAELAGKIAVAQEALAKPTPWGRWKPEAGAFYYFVSSNGTVGCFEWGDDNTDAQHYDFGNFFPTREAAERHAKRLRSMVPTCPVPKVGEDYWAVIFTPTGAEINKWPWRQNECDKALYSLGRVGATEEAAQAWIDEYADAWTTLEDAS